jgi:hypothetical protein
MLDRILGKLEYLFVDSRLEHRTRLQETKDIVPDGG